MPSPPSSSSNPPAPRENIRRLHAYAPGEQPTWADTARPTQPVIKLNTNENPYPPPAAVLEAIRELPGEALRLYPPPTADRFRAAAGEMLGLGGEYVIATNGGDELLRLLITTYCVPRADAEESRDEVPGSAVKTSGGGGGGGGIGVTNPTYSLYPVLADIHGTSVTKVARDVETFAPPSAEALAKQWNDAGCALGFLVNPHAPSGRCESKAYLEALVESFSGLLVIDEAYVDFAQGDAVGLVSAGRKDVVLLRSLSKGYSLAGLRFGFGVAHPEVIATLDKARDSYNTDILSQVAATAAVGHRDEAAKTWQAVKEERAGLVVSLRDRGFFVFDSQSNFLLATPPTPGISTPGVDASDLYHGLKRRNILVRHFDTPGLADKLRITVGTSEQNARFLQVIDELLD